MTRCRVLAWGFWDWGENDFTMSGGPVTGKKKDRDSTLDLLSGEIRSRKMNGSLPRRGKNSIAKLTIRVERGGPHDDHIDNKTISTLGGT